MATGEHLLGYIGEHLSQVTAQKRRAPSPSSSSSSDSSSSDDSDDNKSNGKKNLAVTVKPAAKRGSPSSTLSSSSDDSSSDDEDNTDAKTSKLNSKPQTKPVNAAQQPSCPTDASNGNDSSSVSSSSSSDSDDEGPAGKAKAAAEIMQAFGDENKMKKLVAVISKKLTSKGKVGPKVLKKLAASKLGLTVKQLTVVALKGLREKVRA